MKKEQKFSYQKLFPLLIIMATCFMGIGYASINSITFDIEGEVLATVQDGVFISDVVYVPDESEEEQYSNITFNGTTMCSNITLSEDNPESEVTFEITVYNSYDIGYLFDKVTYDKEFYSNDNITFELIGIKKYDPIDTREYLTFQIVFKYKEGITASEKVNNLNSCINYQFIKYVMEYNYVGKSQSFTPPVAGTYKLEVWGAQGGSYDASYKGGNGGYSYGELYLTTTETLYVYVGEMGKSISTLDADHVSGGWNGGGTSSYRIEEEYDNVRHVSGGGATDIRLVNGNWNNKTSLYSRIIVAGGGSGTLFFKMPDRYGAGGCGGGTTGTDGLSIYNKNYYGKAGTQTAAGTGYQASLNGSFGIGGNGLTNLSHNGSGGGGGWYGGAAGYGYQAGGGGGSGWIYTETSYNNWKAANPTDAANWKVDKKYYLKNAQTIAGNKTITEPNGKKSTGHAGNGYAQITFISSK